MKEDPQISSASTAISSPLGARFKAGLQYVLKSNLGKPVLNTVPSNMEVTERLTNGQAHESLDSCLGDALLGEPANGEDDLQLNESDDALLEGADTSDESCLKDSKDETLNKKEKSYISTPIINYGNSKTQKSDVELVTKMESKNNQNIDANDLTGEGMETDDMEMHDEEQAPVKAEVDGYHINQDEKETESHITTDVYERVTNTDEVKTLNGEVDLKNKPEESEMQHKTECLPSPEVITLSDGEANADESSELKSVGVETEVKADVNSPEVRVKINSLEVKAEINSSEVEPEVNRSDEVSLSDQITSPQNVSVANCETKTESDASINGEKKCLSHVTHVQPSENHEELSESTFKAPSLPMEDSAVDEVNESSFVSAEINRSADSDEMVSPPPLENSSCDRHTPPNDTELTISGDVDEHRQSPCLADIKNTMDDILGRTVAEIEGMPVTNVRTERASPHVSPRHSDDECGDLPIGMTSTDEISEDDLSNGVPVKRARMSPSFGGSDGRLKKLISHLSTTLDGPRSETPSHDELEEQHDAIHLKKNGLASFYDAIIKTDVVREGYHEELSRKHQELRIKNNMDCKKIQKILHEVKVVREKLKVMNIRPAQRSVSTQICTEKLQAPIDVHHNKIIRSTVLSQKALLEQQKKIADARKAEAEAAKAAAELQAKHQVELTARILSEQAARRQAEEKARLAALRAKDQERAKGIELLKPRQTLMQAPQEFASPSLSTNQQVRATVPLSQPTSLPAALPNAPRAPTVRPPSATPNLANAVARLPAPLANAQVAAARTPITPAKPPSTAINNARPMQPAKAVPMPPSSTAKVLNKSSSSSEIIDLTAEDDTAKGSATKPVPKPMPPTVPAKVPSTTPSKPANGLPKPLSAHDAQPNLYKSLQQAVSVHPAPLPACPLTGKQGPLLKPLSPRLELSSKNDGIVLQWNMNIGKGHAKISTYQIFGYKERSGPLTGSEWKKVGDLKALPLPMACTLTQFQTGHTYHFSVRAVDELGRTGPFSLARSTKLE